MTSLPFVLLHSGGVTGFAAIGVLSGLAVFVFVLAYMLSAFQRDRGRDDAPSSARR